MGNEPELSELLPFFLGRSKPGLQKAAEIEPVSPFASHQSPFPPKHHMINLFEKINISLLNLLMSETIKLQFYPLEGGGGEGGILQSFILGGSALRSNPLTFYTVYTTLTKTVLLPNTFY